MDRLTTKPLIKEKLFGGVLGLGFACLGISAGIFIYMLANFDSCLPVNACEGENMNYEMFCVNEGAKYCCGGYGGNKNLSCKGYIANCRLEGYGYIECDDFHQAQKILGAVMIFILITLTIIAKIHEKNLARRKPEDDPSFLTIESQIEA